MYSMCRRLWFRRIRSEFLTAGFVAFYGAAGVFPAEAGTISVPIEVNDQVVLSDGTLRFVGDPAARVGLGYNTTTPAAYVMPFKLPAIPAGERIISATLSLNIEGWYNSSALHNVDLYGIGTVSATSAVNTGYYVNGLNPATNASAHLLQDNFITPSDITSTSATGMTVPKVSQDFGWLVQALYDDGGIAGKYGFVTLAHDAALTLMRYYTVTSANSTVKPKPVLTIVTGTLGRSYYLDTVAGSDAASGSALSPWKTFDHAQTVLQPGQTLYCSGSIGVVHMYSGTGLAPTGEHPYAMGTATQPISYRAWAGQSQPHIAELIFDGVKKDTYLSFDGFLFSPGPVADADYVKHNAINLTGAWHIAFTNCDVEGASLDIPAGALPPDPADSFAPYAPSSLALRQTNPAISSGYPGNASYVTVQNCRIRNCGIGIMVYENEAYAATKAARYWQILNNDVSHASEDGLRFAGGDAGAGSVVKGNKIHEQDACQAMYAWYGYVYRNDTKDTTAFDNKQWKRVKQTRSDGTVQTGIVYFIRVDDASDGYSQLFILPDDRNVPMLRNVSSVWEMIDKDTDGSTIQFRPRVQDTVVSGTTVQGAPANGDSAHTDCISVMGQMTGGFFENNRAEVSERGGGALKIENIPLKVYTTPPAYLNRHPTNITFQNNLFYSTGNPPVKAALFIVAGGKNCWFIHNTIFGGPYYNPDGAIRFSKDSTVMDTSDFKVSFYNNIIAGGGTSNFSAGDPLAISEHNFWMRPPYSKTTATTRPGINSSTTDTVMPIGATVPELIHFVSFADAANGDLHIEAGSLAADIGLPDSAAGGLTIPSGHLPSVDINGFSRGTAPDAGAYEVGSPADPPTP